MNAMERVNQITRIARWLVLTVLCALLLSLAPQAQASSKLYYVHNDHLGARVVTDSAKTVVWKAQRQPYGETKVTINTLTFDPRFPGQTADNESGLHQNYLRSYDPSTGRYLEADPIGQAGGINLYAYANGNPLSYTDPTGQCPWCIALVAIELWNIYDTASDVVDTAHTLSDQCASGSDKLKAVGLLGLGIIDPTPGNLSKKVVKIANPVSETLARVVPGHIRPTTLGKPGEADIFVTNASELRGLSAKGIAQKLTIPESASGFRIIEFPSANVSGIASPVFRANPGFVGAGKTAGGASEFVIPNGPIPVGAVQRIVP